MIAHLVAGVLAQLGVGRDDGAVPAPARIGVEDDGPLTADAQDAARQDSRIAVVQPEAPAIRLDITECIGQKEQIAMLEDLGGPQVRRPDDRTRAGREGPGWEVRPRSLIVRHAVSLVQLPSELGQGALEGRGRMLRWKVPERMLRDRLLE